MDTIIAAVIVKISHIIHINNIIFSKTLLFSPLHTAHAYYNIILFRTHRGRAKGCSNAVYCTNLLTTIHYPCASSLYVKRSSTKCLLPDTRYTWAVGLLILNAKLAFNKQIISKAREKH